MASPAHLVKFALIEEERTISSLSPVALIARPGFVLKILLVKPIQ